MRKIEDLMPMGNRTGHIEQSSRICKGKNLVVRTSDEQFDSIYYIGMAISEIGILLFNLLPLVSMDRRRLKMIARGGGCLTCISKYCVWRVDDALGSSNV